MTTIASEWRWRLLKVIAIVLSFPTLAAILKLTSNIVPWFLGYIGLSLLAVLTTYVAFGEREKVNNEHTWLGAVAFSLLWVIPFIWFAPIYVLYLYIETRWKDNHN